MAFEMEDGETTNMFDGPAPLVKERDACGVGFIANTKLEMDMVRTKSFNKELLLLLVWSIEDLVVVIPSQVMVRVLCLKFLGPFFRTLCPLHARNLVSE